MSCLLPQELVEQIRHQVDVSIRAYGMDCTIFIPTNLNAIDENTIYTTYQQHVYVSYATQVFIEWSPNQQRLRELGLHMEKEVPIIAWFANKFLTEGSEEEIDVDIIVGSYFRQGIQFIPDKDDVEEFDIVDVIVRGMALDKVALKAYKIAPRRVRT